jgi:hypothetical protein
LHITNFEHSYQGVHPFNHLLLPRKSTISFMVLVASALLNKSTDASYMEAEWSGT